METGTLAWRDYSLPMPMGKLGTLSHYTSNSGENWPQIVEASYVGRYAIKTNP
jgi:hypothetical protein